MVDGRTARPLSLRRNILRRFIFCRPRWRSTLWKHGLKTEVSRPYAGGGDDPLPANPRRFG